MSNFIEDAAEEAEAQLPEAAFVTTTGATINVRGICREEAETLNGHEFGRKEFRLVEYFSTDEKFVFQLVTGVKHKVTA